MCANVFNEEHSTIELREVRGAHQAVQHREVAAHEGSAHRLPCRPAFIGPNEDQIVFDMVGTHDLRYRWAAMDPAEAGDGEAYAGCEPLDPALADRFAFVRESPSSTVETFESANTGRTRRIAPCVHPLEAAPRGLRHRTCRTSGRWPASNASNTWPQRCRGNRNWLQSP